MVLEKPLNNQELLGTKIDLRNVFEMQKGLDIHIEKEHPRNEDESRQLDKVLALLVELGELANETRCFKFWSNKPASEKQAILEEFVDGFHFLLSLGLEMKVEKFVIEPIKLENLTKQFLGIYNVFSIFQVAFSDKTYGAAFSAYLGLGEMLGFTWEQIEQAYMQKNAVNHQRQVDGY